MKTYASGLNLSKNRCREDGNSWWERLHVWALINLMREFGHATGRGDVFCHSQVLWLHLAVIQRRPHCESCYAGMIAVFYVLIECMKTLRKWKEAGNGNKSANHLPWVRSRCRLRNWLHVVLIVHLFLHTHGRDLQSNLILLNATPRMPQWGGNDSWLLYFMSYFANAGKSNTVAHWMEYILQQSAYEPRW